ncbi:MAG: tetratricopeptide repeat protein [Akkermansia sp.]|nr:tetratricopeptide repeat protein [Akkermansia sp.]
MKHTYLTLLAFAFLPHMAFAQGVLPTTGFDSEEETQKEKEKQEVPDWVIELSNLAEEERNTYLNAFQAAKIAYASNRLAICESHLNTCELYFTKNPNVWLLRASVCINLGQYDKAKEYIDKVSQVDPDNKVIKLNLSLLHMAEGNYEMAISETDELLRQFDVSAATFGTRRSLTFRKFLCLLMLERQAEAKELIAPITPLDDSPLYYYAQAALRMYDGSPTAATRELNTADTIFAKDGHLPSYKQNLILSGLKEKMRSKQASSE